MDIAPAVTFGSGFVPRRRAALFPLDLVRFCLTLDFRFSKLDTASTDLVSCGGFFVLGRRPQAESRFLTGLCPVRNDKYSE
jgi:hypothetical protein